jgi:spore maturation protein CgeB
MLQQHSDGLQELTGLTPGVHFVEWTNLNDLKNKVVEWLDPAKEPERKAIAQAGMDFVRRNYSAAAQINKLFNELLPLIENEHALPT